MNRLPATPSWGRRSCRLPGLIVIPIPGARPLPLSLAFNQPRRNGIPLDIMNNLSKLNAVTNPVVIRLVLPKGSSQSKGLIGPPRRGPLQPAHDRGEGMLRGHDHMHMVGHHHPCMQFVELSDGLSVTQGVRHDLCDAGLEQPARARASSVQLRIGLNPTSLMDAQRQSPGQSPGNEDRRVLWYPMRKASFPIGHLSRRNRQATRSPAPLYQCCAKVTPLKQTCSRFGDSI